MNIGGVLEMGRRSAESRMRDACVIRRAGEKVSDGRGGETVTMVQVYPDPSWPEDHPHYDGKCWVSYPGVAFESTFDSAGVTVVQGRIELNLPIGADVEEDDVVVITRTRDNPRLTSLEFRVASEVPRSQGVRQKILCEHNQRGVKSL